MGALGGVRRKAIFALCFSVLPACSLFVSTDGLDDGGAGDASIDAQLDTATPDVVTEAAPPIEGGDANQGTTPPAFRAIAATSTDGGGALILGSIGQPGDLLIAVIYMYNVDTTTTVDPSWQPFPTYPMVHGVDGSYEVYFYYQIAGASQPASYTFTPSTTGHAELILAAYSGVGATSPFNVVAQSTSDSDTLVAPTINTTVANTTVVVISTSDGMLDGGPGSFPAEYTTRLQGGPTLFGDMPLPSPGPAGGVILGGPQNGGAQAFALTPQ